MNSMAEAQALDVRGRIGEMEGRARVDLAACYRLVARFGWDDLVFTHLSARVPGPEHHFLINPYGAMFEEVTASNSPRVDFEGKVVSRSQFSINPPKFAVQGAIHGAPENTTAPLP